MMALSKYLARWSWSIVGSALLVGALAVVAGSAAGVLQFGEANTIMASSGAMALGLILLAAGIFIRLQEAHEARTLDSEFAATEQELRDALQLSKELERRFAAAQIAPARITPASQE